MSRSHAPIYVLLSATLIVGCDLGVYQEGAADGDGGVTSISDAGPLVRPDAQFESECSSCHGDENSPAPPRNLAGDTATSAAGVGAHRSHLNASPTWHAPIRCESCHVVPTENGSPGHLDGDGVAEVTFNGTADKNGGSWNGTGCTTYCHGSSLAGGTLTELSWTRVDGTQKACGTCHGAPPPAPHPESSNCGACHPTMQPGTTDVFLDPASHINGVVDLSNVGDGACDSCHGSDGIAAPPSDLQGNTNRSAPGVGAHRQHLGTSSWRREITCSQCHQVPATVDAPGHLDGDKIAEVPFDGMNPQATYNRANASCGGLYCHGNGWSTTGTVSWTADLSIGCGSCHEVGTKGETMSGKHKKHFEEDMSCNGCHAGSVDENRVIIAPNLHINGRNELSIPSGGTWNPATRRCSNLACHENEDW